MNVAAILKEKGRQVSTIGPDAKMHDVAKALEFKRIGAIVVVEEEDRVLGIISERDIIRVVAHMGISAMEVPVHEVMTKSVIICVDSDTIAELMSKMTTMRVRHLPVVDDDRLTGIVSIGDVVKHHIAEVEMEASALRDYIATG